MPQLGLCGCQLRPQLLYVAVERALPQAVLLERRRQLLLALILFGRACMRACVGACVCALFYCVVYYSTVLPSAVRA